MGRVKMYEVARHAGVSAATVSRVVNNRGPVAKSTREGVLRAMEELGARQSIDQAVAFIFPEPEQPFFFQVALELERTFTRLGWHLLISSSDRTIERELELIARFNKLDVRGLIYVPVGPSSDVLLDLVASSTLPFVVLDRRISGSVTDFIGVDNRLGIRRAFAYLRARGHRAIGFLGGTPDSETARARHEAFVEEMKSVPLPIQDEWILQGDFTFESGSACAELLLKLGKEASPTAVMAANDCMAIALMHRLQRAGWTLPADLSVVGFDDITGSRWSHPGLTTVRQPISQIAHRAVDLLLSRIKEFEVRNAPTNDPKEILLEPTLIRRHSVSTPRPTTHAAATD